MSYCDDGPAVIVEGNEFSVIAEYYMGVGIQRVYKGALDFFRSFARRSNDQHHNGSDYIDDEGDGGTESGGAVGNEAQKEQGRQRAAHIAVGFESEAGDRKTGSEAADER